jgi:nicotinamidase-related amidase
MPIDLASLIAPDHTALITSEVQRNVVGDQSVLPVLAANAPAMIPNVARLAAAARAAGVRVIHGTAERRADGAGSNTNARLFHAVRKSPVRMDADSKGSEVVPEIGVDERDIVLTRLHGLSPMAGTSMDAVLRNLGVTTVVLTGVSVNVAITNLAFDAVNLGYQVVIPRDAVAGVPPAYADEVIANTLSVVATITTTDDVLTAWKA